MSPLACGAETTLQARSATEATLQAHSATRLSSLTRGGSRGAASSLSAPGAEALGDAAASPPARGVTAVCPPDCGATDSTPLPSSRCHGSGSRKSGGVSYGTWGRVDVSPGHMRRSECQGSQSNNFPRSLFSALRRCSPGLRPPTLVLDEDGKSDLSSEHPLGGTTGLCCLSGGITLSSRFSWRATSAGQRPVHATA